jgi:hypothetical protein
MKKRSFKIATAFAGAAAATMGLGPTALAATALPASRSKSIRVSRCTDTISQWVHVYYPGGPTSHVAECFGFKGKTTAGARIFSACPGNNSASLHFASHGADRLHPGGGRAFVAYSGIAPPAPVSAYLNKVSIFRWSGHSKCSTE